MSKKHSALAAIVPALFAFTVGGAAAQTAFPETPSRGMLELQELRKAIAISAIKVDKVKGSWQVAIEYSYTGEFKRGAAVSVAQVVMVQDDPREADWSREFRAGIQQLQPGAHTVTVPLPNPNTPGRSYRTVKVIVRLLEGDGVLSSRELGSEAVDHAIRWPEPTITRVEAAIGRGEEQKIVDEAVELIDGGSREQLGAARYLLQALVERSPKVDSAYVELARLALSTDYSATKRREAETLLQSALALRPDSVNAKILLGHVYAHQQRYPEAEKLFAEVSRSDPPNLWLWANWANLLAKQGRMEEAIAKYREAIRRNATHRTYDRARFEAYERLLGLLAERGDLDAIEALHVQRTKEYPARGCFAIGYGRFLVVQRGDAERALAVLRESPSHPCQYDDPREVQALAHYVLWAGGRAEALHQARAFQPVGPRVFYSLAYSARTVGVARKLLAAGEKIDVHDAEEFDALGYALREGDTTVAQRLLDLGARPDAPQGAQKLPAALLPVLARDASGIRLMRKAGIDYAKLRYQGTTAVDYARSQGDAELLQWLDPRGGKL